MTVAFANGSFGHFPMCSTMEWKQESIYAEIDTDLEQFD